MTNEIKYLRLNPSPLRQARISAGYSLAEMEAKTGISSSTLDRIENGASTPKRADARKLYRFFKYYVPLESIYDPYYYTRSQNAVSD